MDSIIKKTGNKTTPTPSPTLTSSSTARGGEVLNEWQQKYLRALADYQNLEKRVNSEKEALRRYAAENIIRQILPIIDSLEAAQLSINNQGLTIILKQFLELLKEYGVVKRRTVGQVFDPHTMECIEVASGKDNIVVKELTAGYEIFDRTLRPAKVVVGKNSKEDKTKES